MFGVIKRWLFLQAMADIKRHKKQKPPLHHNPMQHIHVLYESSTEDDNESVNQWVRELKKSGKNVNALGFALKKESVLPETHGMYHGGEIKFNSIPESDAVKAFIKDSSHVLIVLCHHFFDHMRYITFAQDADLKIGLHFPKAESYFNLLIDIQPNVPYRQMIKSIEQSISILSQTTKS